MAILPDPDEFSWSCGSIKPADLTGLTPHQADQVEAVMMLARGVTDGDGKRLLIRLPPSAAWAIINAIGADRPQAEAARILGLG